MDSEIIAGDNLEVMCSMPSESVDLIATDPPFNTGRDFGEYDDAWGWGPKSDREYESLAPEAQIVASTAKRLHSTSMGAYLCFLAVRVAEMRRLLKPIGSLYLHCDTTANSYIRLMLDAIFGARNFRNEIVWNYRTGGGSRRYFRKKHDVIFFYSKTDDYVFHRGKERSYPSGVSEPGFKAVEKFIDERGRWYWMASTTDVWQINALGRNSKERAHYPTQKPVTLYERIISASSSVGGVVLDPFMGSGTTLVAARNLGRQYIGIDANPEAVKIAERRIAGSLL